MAHDRTRALRYARLTATERGRPVRKSVAETVSQERLERARTQLELAPTKVWPRTSRKSGTVDYSPGRIVRTVLS